MREPADLPFSELSRRIWPGDVVFAWWPVTLLDRSGHYRDGWAWLTHVRRLRCIGAPRYFYTRIEEPDHER